MTTKTIQDLTPAQLSVLLDIHCQLSPENLSCDGELSRNQSIDRFNVLMRKLKAFQLEHSISVEETSEDKVYAEWSRRGSPNDLVRP